VSASGSPRSRGTRLFSRPSSRRSATAGAKCPFGERSAVTIAAHLRPGPADTLSG
jgi:hypothetical protein